MKHKVRLLVVLLLAIGGALTAAPAAAQEKNRSGDQRWEFSYFLGGTRGSTFNTPSSKCTASSDTNVIRGCDVTFAFVSNNPPFFDNPYDDFAASAGIPNFLVNSTPEARNGPQTGFRLGVDLNPRWQIEFQFAAGAAKLASNGPETVQAALLACTTDGDCSPGHEFIVAENEGRNAGNQQTYLFNINYHINEARRIVPYVGAGAGWQRWYNNPNFLVHLEDHGDFLDASSTSKATNAFAMDMVGGVKIHATRNFGIRLELMNVVSVPRFEREFRSVDVNGFFTGTNGALVDVSGSTRQRHIINQVGFNAGVFWRF